MVIKVYTSVPNGAYTAGLTIPIITKWDAPVAVQGCPKIMFEIAGQVRYAKYVSGTGTTDLIFDFLVTSTDLIYGLDYYGRFSLKFGSCIENDPRYFTNPTDFWIRRDSTEPIVDVNRTLPWIQYVETVIAPTSLTGGGYIIALSGATSRPMKVWADVSNRTYSVGDLLNFYVEFSLPVMINDTLSLNFEGITSQAAYSAKTPTPTYILSFQYAIHSTDYSESLTYADVFAISARLSSCSIQNVQYNICGAQNIPAPGTAQDLLSPKGLQIVPRIPEITDFNFNYRVVEVRDAWSGGQKVFQTTALGDIITYRECDWQGYSSRYSEVIDLEAGRRILSYDSCPNHYSVTKRPGFGPYQTGAYLTAKILVIPLFPVMRNSDPVDLTCTENRVAVALNGVEIYTRSASSLTCGDVMPSVEPLTDQCGGYVTSSGVYKYHTLPTCLASQLTDDEALVTSHGPLIGWALDGFPVYNSYQGINGKHMEPCSVSNPEPLHCLDSCNGYLGWLPEVDQFYYRYYMRGGSRNPNTCDMTIFDDGTDTCTYSNDPCCSTIDIPPAMEAISIGCFKGCTNDEPTCAMEALVKGYQENVYVPAKSAKPTSIFQSGVEVAAIERSAMARDYIPSYWDLIDIRNTLGYFTVGQMLAVELIFSEFVYVRGRPYINLFDDDENAVNLYYIGSNDSRVEFSTIIDNEDLSGKVHCNHNSRVNLNGGQIYSLTNYIPISEANVYLRDLCCNIGDCFASADVIPDIPYITNVNVMGQTYLSGGDLVNIQVQFSGPILVIGDPRLRLQIKVRDPARASENRVRYALFSEVLDNSILSFQISILGLDYSPSMDCDGIDALEMSDGHFDGVYKAGVYEAIKANTDVPLSGYPGSVGREAYIEIDQIQPKIISLSAQPSTATIGDLLVISIGFTIDIRFNGCELAELQSSSIDLLFYPTGKAPYPIFGQFHSISGNTLQFSLPITTALPSGDVYLGGTSPLDLGSCNIQSAGFGIQVQEKFATELTMLKLSNIDNNLPEVRSIFSNNTKSIYPFGVGDVIDIYIEMTYDVSILTEPTLAMSLEDGVSYATFVYPDGYVDGDPIKTLYFQYWIVPGDNAEPLDYIDMYSLQGDIRRWTQFNPTLIAIRILPEPGAPGSLAYCCNLLIQCDAPYVDSLLPLKRAGIYGANEVIVILARFTKPVQVLGSPVLEVVTGKDSVQQAVFIPTPIFPESLAIDVPLDLRSTDVLFQYTVSRSDNVLSIYHSGVDAIKVNGTFLDGNCTGDCIVHATKYPTISADVVLREYGDFTPVKGLLQRQWKFRYAQKIEVLVRDLYHTQPESLSATMEHLGTTASVFDKIGAGKTFGRSYPGSRLGNNFTITQFDTGIGYDYFFSDTRDPNIARKSAAVQSSTGGGTNAIRATDNNNDPLIGHNSVSETKEEFMPWWQIIMPVGSKVQTINIWPRAQQAWLYPVVKLSIKGFDSYPRGKFNVKFTNIKDDDPSFSVTSDEILFGTSALDMKTVIERLQNIGKVDVSATEMQPCSILGCGTGIFEKGIGTIYEIMFLSIKTARPGIEIVNVVYLGGPVTIDGTPDTELNPANPVNQLQYNINTRVEVVREGAFVETPFMVEYAKGVEPPELPGSIAADTELSVGENPWLTPCWLMMFDEANSPPPLDLEEAKNVSLWSYKLEEATRLAQIVLPEAVEASVFRIQREGFGSLALAEVQVYAEKINTLNYYNRQKDIEPSPVTRPYQSEIPFQITYGNLNFGGRWILQLIQEPSIPYNKDPYGFSGSFGTVSDWVLVITDLTGVVHTYYQDLRAEIETLPKYGTLFRAPRGTDHPYGGWNEAFDVEEGQELEHRAGGQRYLGYCYSVDTSGMNGIRSPISEYRYCRDNYGVGTLIGNRRLGATSKQYFMRDERMVMYKPKKSYLGPDFFTYRVIDGLEVQSYKGGNGELTTFSEVTTHVRFCRKYISAVANSRLEPVHPLCSCAASESGIIHNITHCEIARYAICELPSSRNDFLNLCLTCNDLGFLSGECQAETSRALGMLVDLGFCSSMPRMDCAGDTFTKPGREVTNYLSLKTWPAFGSFTNLGKSFAYSYDFNIALFNLPDGYDPAQTSQYLGLEIGGAY